MRVLGILLAVLLAGCSPNMVTYSPIAKPTQITRYINGQPSLFSIGERSVSIAPASPVSASKERARFFVMVQNGSDQYFDIGSEHITAFFQRGSQVAPVRVLSYADLAYEIEKQEKSRRIANAFSAAGASMQASSAGAAGNHSAAAIKNIEAQMHIDNSKVAALEAENERLGLQQNLFLTQSVIPGSFHSGAIVLDSENIKGDGLLVLVVDLDGELQRFTFERSSLAK